MFEEKVRRSLQAYAAIGVNFPVCGNRECYYYGDTTPTSGPHTNRCLMCNEPQITVAELQAQETSVKKQIKEDTCVAHGIFCCELCYDMEAYLWDYTPERK